MAPRSLNRILVNLLTDGALAAAAAPVARYLAAPADGLLHPIWFVAGGAITLLLSGVPARLPQQYWRFAGLGDLLGVAIASVSSAALFSLGLVLTGYSLPSVTFPVVHALTLMAFLSAPRLVYRLYHGRGRGEAQSPPVLLIGADEAADLFLRAAAQDRGPALRIAGLISLGRRQTGRRLRGHTILGGLDELDAVLARLRRRGRTPSALVLTEPEFSGAPLAALMATADAAGIPVRRAPRPTALLSAERTGEASRIELRPVAIEDLLNRPQVPLDREAIALLVRGRRVLVTGAGGTIGAELARQLAGLAPAELVLLDNGEYALWQIDTELAEIAPEVTRRVVIADVRDATRIRAAFQAHEPELVFHAAALKHVPMVEANPLEGLLTNAVGTRHVADAARAVGASAMVLISTDKAVNPTSMMGASKRLAEMYCQALDIAARAGGGMRLVTVRFGNVLGSTGSVVPLFRRQLERGGPLTVTHPDMQRYFMTVREAVGLVLQASVLGAAGSPPTGAALRAAGFAGRGGAGRGGTGGSDPGRSGGDGGDAAGADGVSPSLAATVPASTLAQEAAPEEELGGIYVLDMGEPVRIVDLARQMIRLAGLREGEDVAIRYTGLRPGEKLYEELFHGREPPVPTGQPGLLMASPRTVDPVAMARALDAIASACQGGQVAQALLLLSRLVPEYTHDPLGAQPARPTPIRPVAGALPGQAGTTTAGRGLAPKERPMSDTPIRFLDLPAQQARLGEGLRRRIDAVIAHCGFVLGPEVAELEGRLAAYCGAAHCVGVSSGTDALQIAMMAEGIGPGDAVFLPAFTYTATAEVPLVLGATPVFVDVDPDTFQIDIADLARRIEAVRGAGRLRPRAIVGVDLFGQPADWPALRDLAGRHDLFLLDDCAQAFGASLGGRKLGREAAATAISFFPSKPLGAYGDGGALLTDDAERAALYRSLRTHGEGAQRYEVLRTGVNGRLDTLQAAVLLAKLDVFDEELAAREAVARVYDRRLGALLQVPARVADSASAWAVYAVLLPDQATRDRVQAALRDAAVPTAIYYPRPLHHQPAYRDNHAATGGGALPVSEDLATRILALPIHPDLGEAAAERVCDAMAAALG